MTTNIDTAIAAEEFFGYPDFYDILDPELVLDEYEWSLDSTDFPLLKMPTSDTIVGVALNGVFFFTATNSYKYDALFPKAYGIKTKPRALEVDQCLGTPENFNTYGYRTFTPCIYGIVPGSEPYSCSSKAACINDTMNYAIAPVPSQLRAVNPIGYAKDGRVIYGPFRSDGTLW